MEHVRAGRAPATAGDTEHASRAAGRSGGRTGAAARDDLSTSIDASPRLTAQRVRAQAIDHSPVVTAQRRAADAITRSTAAAAQRRGLGAAFGPMSDPRPGPEHSEAPGAAAPGALQRTADADEDDVPSGSFAADSGRSGGALLQAKAGGDDASAGTDGATANDLPEPLASGIESLSGQSMDDVQVHRNSSRPAQLGALAYAQGRDIHIAPGQEQHLPHEAWHVVQQAQGRVRPTVQLRGDVPVNDDAGLEREADVMGARAMQQARAPRNVDAGREALPVRVPVGPPAQLARGRKGANAHSQWAQMLQQHGVVPALAQALGLAFVQNGPSIVVIREFGLGLAAWTPANAVSLIRRFLGAPGALTATQWIAVANAHAGLVDHEADVAAFARMAGGWTPVNQATLAGLFGANPAGHTAAEWVAVAMAHAGLANHENDVAAFARIGGGWTAANLATLAGLFGANPAAHTAAEWAAVATAHAGLADHENDVAAFARIGGGWNAANLATLAGLFGANPGAQTAAQWALMAVAHANFTDHEADVAALARLANWTPADLAAMAVAGWTNADLVAFVNRMIAVGRPVAAVQTLLGTNGFAASSITLINAGWTAVQTADFAAAALASGLTAADLQGSMGQAGCAAAAVAMIAAGWPHADLGTFVGRVRQAGVAAAALQALLVTPGIPAASQAMIGAGWTVTQLGDFAGAALVANLTAANLQALLITPNFPASGLAMLNAGWVAIDFGTFVANVLATGLTAADLVLTLQAANFPARSLAMLGVGWNAAQAGQFVGQARLVPLPAANLSNFLGAAGAAAAGAALLGAATWGAGATGMTVGHVLTRVGPPTYAQLVWLLQRSQASNWQSGSVQSAATANMCGAPAWATVQAQAPLFVGVWVGPPGPVAVVPNVVFAGALHGGGYSVSLGINGNRQQHVQEGHTYEHFLFTYANCMRNFGGNIGMLAVATNVGALVGALPANGAVQGLADRSAWINPPGPASFLQQDIANYRVGVQRTGPPVGGVGGTYPVGIVQYYPRPAAAAAVLQGADLVAIGRLMGQIP